MNANELIRDALQDIGRVAAEQPITGDEGATAIRYLNNLMYSKVHLGLGYTVVTNGSDTITTPAYAWEWMIKALAVRLAAQFGQLESYGAIKQDEKNAYSIVLSSTGRLSPPQLSGNVPYGSGNRDTGDGYSKKFYTETDDGVLTETNQQIIVEDDT